MYPIITIRWSQISMTGIGVVITIITFLIVAYLQTKHHNLQFRKLFYWLPLPIITAYILGAYSNFVLMYGKLLPSNIQEILMILSPYDFQFHFVWIVTGLAISIIIFLNTIKFKEEKLRRIESIAYAMSIGFIPLGIFFLLGDNVIGRTNQQRGIMTFSPQYSKRNSFGKVLPVWLYLSIAGALTTGLHIAIKQFYHNIKVGYLTIAILTILTNIALYFQQSPKYWVLAFLDITLDIKAYLSFVIVMICIQQFLLQKQ